MLPDMGNVTDNTDSRGIWVDARVVGVQAVDVGEEEEVVCMHDRGRDGRQRVVVSKLDFL